jgi:hypothetical protein
MLSAAVKPAQPRHRNGGERAPAADAVERALRSAVRAWNEPDPLKPFGATEFPTRARARSPTTPKQTAVRVGPGNFSRGTGGAKGNATISMSSPEFAP